MSKRYIESLKEAAKNRFHDLACRMDIMLDQQDDGLYCVDMVNTLEEMRWQYFRIAALTEASDAMDH